MGKTRNLFKKIGDIKRIFHARMGTIKDREDKHLKSTSRPRGMEWGGRREEGSGWGTHVYLWRIRFDVWQN